MAKPTLSTPKEAKLELPFAVVESGSKQYIISDGVSLRVEKLEASVGETVTFDKVLMTADAKGAVKIGTPYLEGVTVSVVVAEQGKGRKIRVTRFKAKSNRHKTYGHRQPFTKVKVTKI